MAKFRVKQPIVEARQHDGSTITVIHDVKGEQRAKKGDWLVGSERGQIEVLSDVAFKAKYAPVEENDK